MAKKAKCQYKPGRNFFSFPRSLIQHQDYFSMTYAAKALLHDMCALYNGFNNGDISIPISVMKKFGWPSATLDRAKDELLSKAWIYKTRQGGKGKHFSCSLYAISFIPLDDIGSKIDACFRVGQTTREFKKT